MEKILKLNLIISYIFFIIVNISFINCIENNKEDFKNLINNYYSSDFDNIININIDEYRSGNITENKIDYYNISLLNDSEEIFFDYQSEYGCLHISINDINLFNEYDFIFCSEGINSLFTLNKNDILSKINENEKDSIKGLNIIIGVGYPNSTINKKDYKYSLRVSLRKPDINIFEINSEHKILCKTENINETNYKCLFIIKYDDKDNKSLIIYPTSQIKKDKLNIYANFINKDYYNNWDKEYLINNIPNNNSNYTNYNLEQDYIYIPFFESNKYIYVSIESDFENIIEIYSQIIYENEDIKIPNINEMKIYHINNSISLDFDSLEIKNISISLVTLNGKSSIYWEYDNSKEYITDIRENKIILNTNLESCLNNCKLIINNINNEENNNELGYIFYILYSEKYDNNIDELLYEKSIKLSYDNINFPIMLYAQIPNISSPIDINLQFYNISELNSTINDTIINIEVSIITLKDIYQITKDNSNISLNNSIKGKFNSGLFASNIHLNPDEMEKFNIKENATIFIIISNNMKSNNSTIEKLILGSTISQNTNLIYSSERIYHYGQLNNEEKIIYKLRGILQYHLMKLEIGLNSDFIGWSVKRKIDENNYKKNDTDLSFVIEKGYNGRGLITLYIERGEDIYLTFFKNNKINNNLTNYIFKYNNAKKNNDYKNNIIKKDTLFFDENDMTIKVNKINNIQNPSNINYYLKIIKEEDYIYNELLKTIAITESPCYLNIKGFIDNDMVIFKLENYINKNKSYNMNVYSHIITNDYNIEYISYNGIILNLEESETNNNIIYIILISVGCILLLCIIIIIICIYRRKRRNRILGEMIARINFLRDEDDLLE